MYRRRTPQGEDQQGNGSMDLLLEMERNTPDEIRRQRAHNRIALKSKVVVQPGNSGDRMQFKAQGVSGDISRGGCQILFPAPLRVGDVYMLTFDRGEIDLPPTFARCLRCRLVREDAYEAGFSFFAPVTLSPDLDPSGELLG